MLNEGLLENSEKETFDHSSDIDNDSKVEALEKEDKVYSPERAQILQSEHQTYKEEASEEEETPGVNTDEWEENNVCRDFLTGRIIQIRGPIQQALGMINFVKENYYEISSWKVYSDGQVIDCITILRNLNDFKWLRDCIVQRYYERIVPCLPKISLIGNNLLMQTRDETEITQLLCLFLQKLIFKDAYSECYELNAFLKFSNEEFKVLLKNHNIEDYGVKTLFTQRNLLSTIISEYYEDIMDKKLNITITRQDAEYLNLESRITFMYCIMKEFKETLTSEMVNSESHSITTLQIIGGMTYLMDLTDNKNIGDKGRKLIDHYQGVSQKSGSSRYFTRESARNLIIEFEDLIDAFSRRRHLYYHYQKLHEARLSGDKKSEELLARKAMLRKIIERNSLSMLEHAKGKLEIIQMCFKAILKDLYSFNILASSLPN